MNFLPDSISRLIDELSKLPGIGPKSAQRLAFHLLKSPDSSLQKLGESISKAKEGVIRCETCHALASKSPCPLCCDPGRDRNVLCIVETTLDMIAIEKTGEFHGLYHILMGKISPLDGVGPDDLRIAELFERVSEPSLGESDLPELNESNLGESMTNEFKQKFMKKRNKITEVILALNPDLDGDTTALFLHQKLASLSAIQISRIARGIPSGGNLEYTDDATLIRALQGRQVLS